MTESVKDPHALVVTAQSQMLDKLQLSEVTRASFMFRNAVLGMVSKPTRILHKICHVVNYGMNAQVQAHCSGCITPSNAIRAPSVQHPDSTGHALWI